MMNIPRSFNVVLGLLVAASIQLLACGSESDLCGNGFLDGDEACDGYILAGATCESAGFAGGTLSCRANCTLDMSACFDEGICVPECNASQCEICMDDTCTSSCSDIERCDAGGCVSAFETVEIFVTSDEHGWMSSSLSTNGELMLGGAADLLSRFRADGYEPDSNDSILISDGDMWTGPAVSTWFDGESMVEVMNAMGYSTATIGNHEFDFGQEALAERAEQADFPFLAANLTLEATGEHPDYALPYAIVEVSGVQVGIIGLLTFGAEDIIMPSKLEGLVIGAYEPALRSAVPQALEDGAEVLIVAAHDCEDGLLDLTSVAAELDISVLTAGHCHDWSLDEENGVPVVSPGAKMVEYAIVRLTFNTITGDVVDVDVDLRENYYPVTEESPVEPDTEVAAIVETWLDREDEVLGEVIGYTASGISIGWRLFNLIVDSWLLKFPELDFAFYNPGGVRAAVDAGDISLADILTTLPFENELVLMSLTGEQVVANLTCCGPIAAAGLTVDARQAPVVVTLADGTPIDLTATYGAVTVDFLWTGGNGLLFGEHDPTPYLSGVFDRDPVIDWIREQNTSSDQPLEGLLDSRSRYLQ